MSAKFEQYNHIEVSGDAIFPVIKGLTAEALCRVMLKKLGFEQIEKWQFYPLKNYLELLAKIENKMPTVLKSMGSFICSEAVFPEMITFEQILMMTHEAYHMNHRGHKGEEIGGYLFEKKIRQRIPYNSDESLPMHIQPRAFLRICKTF